MLFIIHVIFFVIVQSRSRQHSNRELKRHPSESLDHTAILEHLQSSRNCPEPLVYDSQESGDSSDSDHVAQDSSGASSDSERAQSSGNSSDSEDSYRSNSNASRLAVHVEPSSPDAIRKENKKTSIAASVGNKSLQHPAKVVFIPPLSTRQRPRPHYLQLFPDLPTSADEAGGLPAMRGARPKQSLVSNDNVNKIKKKKPTQVNETGNLGFRYYDWRCLTKTQKRRRRRKITSRSPSKTRKKTTLKSTATSKKKRTNFKKKTAIKHKTSSAFTKQQITEKPLIELISSQATTDTEPIPQLKSNILHTVHVNPLMMHAMTRTTAAGSWHKTHNRLVGNPSHKPPDENVTISTTLLQHFLDPSQRLL